MKVYKDGHEVYIEKDQLEIFLGHGWSKTKPVANTEKVPETAPELEEEDDTSEQDGEGIDAGEEEEETTTSAPRTGRKTIRKKK